MMISSSGMELLELFLPIASNSPTKTRFVMGCKGPIFHLCHKRVFQHRSSWSITVSHTVSLQEHQHLVLGEMPQLQKKHCANHYHAETSITKHPSSYNPKKTPDAA